MTFDPAASLTTPHSSDSAKRWRWQDVAGLFGGAVLGAVLLVGAWAKLLDPLAFVDQIRAEGLDFLLPAAAVAGIALALEIGLGSSLVLGIRRLWVLVPAALLVAFFLFLTGRTYYRDLHGTLEAAAGCGCFGNLIERTPAQAFWQDLLLLVPPLFFAMWGRTLKAGLPWRRLVVVAGALLAGMLFAWKSPSLPIDDFATQLRPGRLISDFCGGAGDDRVCLQTISPQLLIGVHTLVIANLADQEFIDTVPRLNAAIDSGEQVVVLATVEPGEVRTFFWTHGPAFEILEVPPAVLKPLYRSLPRSFRVRDGVVAETFRGFPPLPSVPPQ